MKLILDLGNLWDMLSALGTIGAVVLSLWLARRTEKPNLYIYYCMDYDSETDKTTHIFEILNIGQVPTTLLYEGLSLYKRIIFSKQVEFDGVLEWTYNEKNLPTHYSSSLRPGESVYLEVEDNIMKKAIQQLVGRRQQGKVYFYIVDYLNKSHFVAVSVQDILEENISGGQ